MNCHFLYEYGSPLCNCKISDFAPQEIRGRNGSSRIHGLCVEQLLLSESFASASILLYFALLVELFLLTKHLFKEALSSQLEKFIASSGKDRQVFLANGFEEHENKQNRRRSALKKFTC